MMQLGRRRHMTEGGATAPSGRRHSAALMMLLLAGATVLCGRHHHTLLPRALAAGVTLAPVLTVTVVLVALAGRELRPMVAGPRRGVLLRRGLMHQGRRQCLMMLALHSAALVHMLATMGPHPQVHTLHLALPRGMGGPPRHPGEEERARALRGRGYQEKRRRRLPVGLAAVGQCR